MNPDQVNEAFNRAVNRGMAEMRSLFQEAANRFEGEIRKVNDAVGGDDSESERLRNAGEQLQGMVDKFRAEATKAVGQFSDGISDVVDEMREFMQDSKTGAGSSTESSEATEPASAAATASSAKQSAAKKSTAKKTAAKKSTAKKSTAKKSTAKKSTAKKSS